MPGWSYNMKGHSHRGYICHLKRCKVPVSEIENMNLVKMVNETFHMIWGGGGRNTLYKLGRNICSFLLNFSTWISFSNTSIASDNLSRGTSMSWMIWYFSYSFLVVSPWVSFRREILGGTAQPNRYLKMGLFPKGIIS